MKENAARWRDVELGKELGIQKRKLNHLLELVDVTLETSDLTEVDIQVNTKRVGIGESLSILYFADVGCRFRVHSEATWEQASCWST
jgi:hypothetical protein